MYRWIHHTTIHSAWSQQKMFNHVFGNTPQGLIFETWHRDRSIRIEISVLDRPTARVRFSDHLGLIFWSGKIDRDFFLSRNLFWVWFFLMRKKIQLKPTFCDCSISWKMKLKFNRKQVSHFWAIYTQACRFFTFARDLAKSVIPETLWGWWSYNFRFWAHPKMGQKRRFPECWCVRRRAQLSRNLGLGGRVIFPYTSNWPASRRARP